MSYRPSRLRKPPGSAPEVSDIYDEVQREFDLIANELMLFETIQLRKTTVAPIKPRDGLVAYADGTSWNPGSGEGFYGYYAGSWKKLG